MKTEIKEMPEKPAFDTPMQYAAMMTSKPSGHTDLGVVGSMKQYGSVHGQFFQGFVVGIYQRGAKTSPPCQIKNL